MRFTSQARAERAVFKALRNSDMPPPRNDSFITGNGLPASSISSKESADAERGRSVAPCTLAFSDVSIVTDVIRCAIFGISVSVVV